MKHFWLLLLAWQAMTASAMDGTFDLRVLPPGKAVTLPHPATTQFPVQSKVNLTSTDLPQTVKVMALPSPGKAMQPLVLHIVDTHTQAVQYVKVDPRNPVLFHFKALKPIMLIPQPLASHVRDGVMLRIESNRPLGVGR